MQKHRLLIALIVLAIVVRVGFLVAFRSTLDFSLEGNAIHGSEAYDAYAQNLLASGVYGREVGVADAMIPPMYSYALTALYTLFGRGFVQVGVFHILLDVISLLLLYNIARRLFERYGHEIGLLAVLFTALYPYLIFQNLTLVDTAFWMMLLHLFVWLMVVLRQQPTLNRNTWLIAILGGLVLGISTLTRPITPPLALLVALWFLFRLNFWQTLFRLLPVAIFSVLVVGVWIVRNFNEFNAFIPMTTTSGSNFWQGNSEWTIAVFQAGYDVQWTAPRDIPRGISAREQDALRFQKAIEYLTQNRQDIPLLIWSKLLVHWNPQITPLYNPQPNEQWELQEGKLVIINAERSITGVTSANISYNTGLLDTLGRPVHLLYFGVLLICATLSFWVLRSQWREVALLWFIQFSMTLMYVLFHPSTRYRSPSDPLLFILSAAVLVSLFYPMWLKNQKAFYKEGKGT
jgi:4-amino-4-deoxy-L-arabinose transferase-like glycosyltransferase